MILCHVARWALLLLICQMSCLSMHAPARAQDFYRGKTLTIVVGFTPGGGFDINARLLARHIGRHIPGNPTIVVQNMPGAAGLNSVQYLDTALCQAPIARADARKTRLWPTLRNLRHY